MLTVFGPLLQMKNKCLLFHEHQSHFFLEPEVLVIDTMTSPAYRDNKKKSSRATELRLSRRTHIFNEEDTEIIMAVSSTQLRLKNVPLTGDASNNWYRSVCFSPSVPVSVL